MFDVVVFLWIPAELRMERLRQRELDRLGMEAPGSIRHEALEWFLAWAAAYDDGDTSIRSRRLHEAWLRALPCPVVRLEGDLSTTAQVAALRAWLFNP